MVITSIPIQGGPTMEEIITRFQVISITDPSDFLAVSFASHQYLISVVRCNELIHEVHDPITVHWFLIPKNDAGRSILYERMIAHILEIRGTKRIKPMARYICSMLQRFGKYVIIDFVDPNHV